MGSRDGPSWIEGPVCPTARAPIRRNPWFGVSRSALAVSNGQSVHPQPEVPGAGEWTGRSCWSPTGFRRQVSTCRPRRPPSDGNGKLKPALLGMPLFPSAWVSRRRTGTDTHQNATRPAASRPGSSGRPLRIRCPWSSPRGPAGARAVLPTAILDRVTGPIRLSSVF